MERGICPIATSTINERTVPIIMAECMAHEREGYISTYGLKSDVTLVLLDPISFKMRKFRWFGHEWALYCVFFIAHARNGRITTSGLKSDVTIVFLDPDFL